MARVSAVTLAAVAIASWVEDAVRRATEYGYASWDWLVWWWNRPPAANAKTDRRVIGGVGTAPAKRDGREEGECLRALDQAGSYAEWTAAAAQLDRLQGRELWKREDDDPALYNAQALRDRLDQLECFFEEHNVAALASSLRSGLVRNLGGMGNPQLFGVCRVGTKDLIGRYCESVVRMLGHLFETPRFPGGETKKFEFFHETRHAFGRTALLLSGGAGLGLFHFGVIKALWQEKVLPRVISGASVGALIGALFCSVPESEFGKWFEPNAVRMDAFDRAGPGSFQRRLKRFVSKGVLMDISKLEEIAKQNLGSLTFLECYRRSGLVLNISVTSPNEPPRLLNYLTSPDVLVWSAACASCALPGLYEPVPLWRKDASGNEVPYESASLVWTDGSVQHDLPMRQLAELFNVNHFIVSQVNPHVVPFLDPDSDSQLSSRHALLQAQAGGGATRLDAGMWTSGWRSLCATAASVWRAGAFLAKSEAKHRVTQLIDVGLLPAPLDRLREILNQPYTGHITISPSLGVNDFWHAFSNPTEERRQECIVRGMRDTWPKIAFIKCHCAIELALERHLTALQESMQGRSRAMGSFARSFGCLESLNDGCQ